MKMGKFSTMTYIWAAVGILGLFYVTTRSDSKQLEDRLSTLKNNRTNKTTASANTEIEVEGSNYEVTSVPRKPEHKSIKIWTEAIQGLFLNWGYKLNEVPKPFGTLNSSKEFVIHDDSLLLVLKTISGLPKPIEKVLRKIIYKENEVGLQKNGVYCHDAILQTRILPKVNILTKLLNTMGFDVKTDYYSKVTELDEYLRELIGIEPAEERLNDITQIFYQVGLKFRKLRTLRRGPQAKEVLKQIKIDLNSFSESLAAKMIRSNNKKRKGPILAPNQIMDKKVAPVTVMSDTGKIKPIDTKENVRANAQVRNQDVETKPEPAELDSSTEAVAIEMAGEVDSEGNEDTEGELGSISEFDESDEINSTVIQAKGTEKSKAIQIELEEAKKKKKTEFSNAEYPDLKDLIEITDEPKPKLKEL